MREIRLQVNPALTEDVTVPADGCISATIVPDQLAYGLTAPGLDAAVQRNHFGLLRIPHVDVVVTSLRPTPSHIGGPFNHTIEFVTAGPAWHSPGPSRMPAAAS